MEINKFHQAKPLVEMDEAVAQLQQEAHNIDKKSEDAVDTSLWGFLLAKRMQLHSLGVDISDIESKVKAEVFNRLGERRRLLNEKIRAI